jgi:hypothetical protein
MIGESQIGEDGRADLSVLEPGCFTPKVQEIGKSCRDTSIDRQLVTDHAMEAWYYACIA